MNSNRVISSLCYFSIFFAGFIFPIVVYLVSNDGETKQHAKSAFWSHIIPFLTVVGAFLIFLFSGITAAEPNIWLLIFGALIVGGVNVVVLIWNIVKGIKVLAEQ